MVVLKYEALNSSLNNVTPPGEKIERELEESGSPTQSPQPTKNF